MSESKPILHILVVGFHHKKGCQVEFSYPPLIPGTEGRNECPSGWKYLPTLALPDGSHNFSEDTVFFNLPSLLDPTDSIYGVSCYRQIPVEKLKIRTADVTRSTVQKSVCILAALPLYGYIEVKLSLIANAFFDQGDFSCTDIIVKAYDQLNACLIDEPNPLCHIDVGLPLREIILKWRHKTLLLFKLFLLQRRVVCFSSPVRNMCTLILGVASLFPKLMQKGFQEVACVRTSRPLSPMPDFSTTGKNRENNFQITTKDCDNETISETISNCMEPKGEIVEGIEKASEMYELNRADSIESDAKKSDRNSLPRDASVDTLASTLHPLISIKPELWHAPIPIFASGHLCLPYLSLPYMDLLTDPSVLSYIIGTSNILFHQKKNLADVQIDVEAGTIETNDLDLRRQLVLTTEDLRFVDFLIRHVQNPKEGAEGSESWIREQFQGYMLALLKMSTMQENTKDYEHFNGHFMMAWKKSQGYLEWYEMKPEDSFFDSVPSGHPFAGTLSVADMKLKLAQTMHNSESGRKINQAVNTTSRAVGGAISQAKGAFSNWWSSITTNPVPVNQQQSQQPLPESMHPHVDSQFAKENESDEQSNDGNKSVDGDITEGEDLCEQIESRNINDELVEEIVEDNSVPSKEDGIVEIAKEAELLDSNKRMGGIYTV